TKHPNEVVRSSATRHLGLIRQTSASPSVPSGQTRLGNSAVSTGAEVLRLANVKRVLGNGPKVEEGKRADQPYLLDSGRFLAVEGTNALDVFFPATTEGLLAGAAFLSSELFTPTEWKQLIALVDGRRDGERVIGRFRVALSAPDTSGWEL